MSSGVTSLTNLDGTEVSDAGYNFAKTETWGIWRKAYQGIALGWRTTVPAIPTVRRYKVNIKSANNSNPALSRIISIRAFLSLRSDDHAAAKSFCSKSALAAINGSAVPGGEITTMIFLFASSRISFSWKWFTSPWREKDRSEALPHKQMWAISSWK